MKKKEINKAEFQSKLEQIIDTLSELTALDTVEYETALYACLNMATIAIVNARMHIGELAEEPREGADD